MFVGRQVIQFSQYAIVPVWRSIVTNYKLLMNLEFSVKSQFRGEIDLWMRHRRETAQHKRVPQQTHFSAMIH